MRIVPLILAASALAAAGCEQPDEQVARPADLGPDATAYYGVTSSALWPSSGGVANIVVCFDSTVSATSSQKAAVEDAIETTWNDASGVHFTGFSTCPAFFYGSRVRIMSGTNPSASRVGYPGFGRETVVTLDFTDPQTPEIAMHEFGHVLGLYHEHEHPDSPGCVIGGVSYGPLARSGATTLGLRYDPYSAMNYCSPDYGDGRLSYGDIVSVQEMYGENDRFMKLTAIPSLTSDPQVFFDVELDHLPNPSYASFEVVGAGDFDDDSDADVLYWYPSNNSGTLRCTTGADRSLWPSKAGDVPLVVGDFNGDGKTDTFWSNPSGSDEVWQSAVSCGYTKYASSLNLGYSPNAHVGDFDGDGADDILHQQAGRWYFATSNGGSGSFTTGGWAYVDGSYVTDVGARIPVVGDFDGDGDDDIYWLGLGSVSDYMWEHTGTIANSWKDPIFTEYSLGWSISYTTVEPVVGKFSGDDDCDDIIFYRVGQLDGMWLADCDGSGPIAFSGGMTTFYDDYDLAAWEDQILAYGR